MTPSSQAVWDSDSSLIIGHPASVSVTAFGITITHDDVLYVSDFHHHRVAYMPLNVSRNINFIASPPFSFSELCYPSDVFVKSNSLYVLCSGNFKVRKMSLNGSNSSVALDLSGFLSTALYLFVDNNDKIYVNTFYYTALLSLDLIKRFNIFTKEPKHWPDSQSIQPRMPFGIYVNKIGSVYIADYSGHQILRWLPGAESATIVAGDGRVGYDLTHLFYPTQIIVDDEEYMYISEVGNRRVTRWTPHAIFGVCIAGCPALYPISLSSIVPYSFAFDSNGSLYINDQYSKVLKFQSRIKQSKRFLS